MNKYFMKTSVLRVFIACEGTQQPLRSAMMIFVKGKDYYCISLRQTGKHRSHSNFAMLGQAATLLKSHMIVQ